MKYFNKKMLVFVIACSIVISSVFGFFTYQSYKFSETLKIRITEGQKKAKQYAISYEDGVLMDSIKDEITDYENKIEAASGVDSQTETSIRVIIENLCRTLSYKASKIKGSKIKTSLSEYFTKECYESQLDKAFVFSDHRAYKIKRELNTIMLSKDSSSLRGLAIVDYTDRNTHGREYIDCEFYYDKSTNAYYISDINIVKG